MNDLIERLWHQSRYPSGRGHDEKKFAQLIIQEVLLSLEPNPYEKEIEHRVDQAFYTKCERIIKQHFGVES